MNPRLKQLYKEVILRHNAQPYHFEKVEEGLIVEANNPLCGDRFRFFLEVDKERVVKAHFHGFGCAISKASASILTQRLEGKTISEAKDFCSFFLDYIEGENREAISDDAIEAFAAVDEFPARKDCAALGWKAINDYLSNKEKNTNL